MLDRTNATVNRFFINHHSAVILPTKQFKRIQNTDVANKN